MPLLEHTIDYADEYEKDLIVQEFENNKKVTTNKKTFTFIDGHYRLNKMTGELNFYTDNEFLH